MLTFFKNRCHRNLFQRLPGVRFFLFLSFCILLLACEQVKKKEIFHKNGTLAESYDYTLNSAGQEVPEGDRLVYNEQGQLIEKSRYLDGLLMGLFLKYYPGGSKRSETNYIGGLKEGPEKTWFENGKVESEREWRQDKKEGIEVLYHPDGTKRTEILYEKGVKTGIQKFWNSRGHLFQEIKWSAGQLVSVQSHVDTSLLQVYKLEYAPMRLAKTYTYYIEEGQQEIKHGAFQEWHENGVLERELSYISGLKWGREQTYDVNGVRSLSLNWEQGMKQGAEQTWWPGGKILKSENIYVNGLLEGAGRSWYPDGEIKDSVSYKAGKKNGLAVSWYSQGGRASEEPYLDNELEGTVIRYSPEGQKTFVCSYTKGSRHGLCKTFYSTGSVESVVEYRQGVRLASTYQRYTESGEPSAQLEAKKIFHQIQDEKDLVFLAKECAQAMTMEKKTAAQVKAVPRDEQQKMLLTLEQNKEDTKSQCNKFKVSRQQFSQKYSEKVFIELAQKADFVHLLKEW